MRRARFLNVAAALVKVSEILRYALNSPGIDERLGIAATAVAAAVAQAMPHLHRLRSLEGAELADPCAAVTARRENAAAA
jgi:hypothetical protein